MRNIKVEFCKKAEKHVKVPQAFEETLNPICGRACKEGRKEGYR